MSEKSEQPTAKRLREAREKGQIARSRMLMAAAATVGGMLGASSIASPASARLHAWTAFLFLHPETGAKAALFQGLAVLAWFAGPVLLGAFAGSLVASSLQAGFQFNPGVLAPKLERIDPAAGLKKLFSARQVVEVGKALVVVAVIAGIVWSAVHNAGVRALGVSRLEGAMAFHVLLRALAPVALRGALALLVLGVCDYLWARRRHVKDLMMTRQERKEEHKSAEGDPRQKAKRKALQRQLLLGGGARGVQKASCVVVNPTHLAIALRYVESEADAPYIVAKGRESDALRLRRHARALGIPIVRDIPLARSLIHYDVGEEIPEELYQAAAAVLKVALTPKQEDGPERRRS